MSTRSRRMRAGVVAAVGVLLAVVAVPGCGGPQAAGGADRPEQGSTTSAATVPVQGKTTVAYFFAVGCVSCLPAAKAVAAVPKTAPDGVEYVAVNMAPGDTASNLRGFLADAGAEDMSLVVDGGPLVKKHQVSALSTTIVFDADGKVAFRGIEAGTGKIATAVKAAHKNAG